MCYVIEDCYPYYTDKEIKAASTLNSCFACSYTNVLNVQAYTAQHSHSCNHIKAIKFLKLKYSIGTGAE